MSADLLREAAEAIRKAVAAMPERVRTDWAGDSTELYTASERSWVAESYHFDELDGGDSICDYFALMHPPVALALADWLEIEALAAESVSRALRTVRPADVINWQALATARAILRRSE